MNLDPREANCLEILADESEKFSLENIIYQDHTDLNQWSTPTTVKHNQPITISNTIPTPRIVTSWPREKRFSPSEVASKQHRIFSRKKDSSNTRFITISPKNSSKVVITNSNVISSVPQVPSAQCYQIYSSEKIQGFSRRASSAIKYYKKSNVSKEDCFLRSTPTPPPCRCNLNTFKCPDGLFCTHHDCINKLLSKHPKEYNVARHTRHIDRYSNLIPKPKMNMNSNLFLDSNPDSTDLPARSIDLKRYHKYLHDENWEMSYNNKFSSSLVASLDDSYFKLPDFTKIHNGRSFEKSSPLGLYKKKQTATRLF